MQLILEELQYVLGIEDWEISVEVVPRYTLQHTGLAEIEGYIRRARIKLCASKERDPEGPTFQETILHELAHIVVADLECFEIPELVKERLVWNLSRGWARLGVEVNEEEFTNGQRDDGRGEAGV